MGRWAAKCVRGRPALKEERGAMRKKIWLPLVLTLLLVTYIPGIVTWLPYALLA